MLPIRKKATPEEIMAENLPDMMKDTAISPVLKSPMNTEQDPPFDVSLQKCKISATKAIKNSPEKRQKLL